MQFAIPAIFAGASMSGAALQAYGSVQQGRETASAAEFERQQLQIQKQQYKTAADQAEARRREEFTANIETIGAARAGRGVGAASPTGLALFSDLSADASRDILTERSNYRTREDLSRRAAGLASRKARTSMLSGYLGAGEAIFKGVAGTAAAFNVPPRTR